MRQISNLQIADEDKLPSSVTNKNKFAKLCQPGYYCYKGEDLNQDFVKRITKIMYYKEYLHKWEGFLITLL